MDATNKAVREARQEAQTAGPTDHSDCRAVADTLARVGDKWTVMVVGTLSQGAMRYNEIGKRVEGISQRMLTLTLKGLEQDGLVSRKMYPTIPPRVDYQLTPMGRTLIEPLHALHQWSRTNRPAMLAARVEYEQKKATGDSGVHPFYRPK